MEGGVVIQLEGGLCSRGVGQGFPGGELPSTAMRGVDPVRLGHDAGLGINPAVDSWASQDSCRLGADESVELGHGCRYVEDGHRKAADAVAPRDRVGGSPEGEGYRPVISPDGCGRLDCDHWMLKGV